MVWSASHSSLSSHTPAPSRRLSSSFDWHRSTSAPPLSPSLPSPPVQSLALHADTRAGKTESHVALLSLSSQVNGSNQMHMCKAYYRQMDAPPPHEVRPTQPHAPTHPHIPPGQHAISCAGPAPAMMVLSLRARSLTPPCRVSGGAGGRRRAVAGYFGRGRRADCSGQVSRARPAPRVSLRRAACYSHRAPHFTPAHAGGPGSCE